MQRIVLALFLFVLWLLLAWPFGPADEASMFVGALVAIATSAYLGEILAQDIYKFFDPVRYFWIAAYVPVFAWACLKANLDVMYRVLHPARPIRPGIVRVRTRLEGDAALTILANSITLTPGTMTVDVDPATRSLFIHWIHVESEDVEEATEMIVSQFERILERIFR